MALRDLVSRSDELDEAAIEEVVKDFVRYDPEKRQILFVPESGRLSHRQKILVYLTAFRGWRYLLPPEEAPFESSPAEIEAETHIVGGSLRPTLRTMMEEGWLTNNEGRYSIPAYNIPRVKEYLDPLPF
ncbi:hypothetical protein M0Q28_01075 [Patescibacteria group bacterium]|jgi:hypothetical protein|nr:hypothetical protein [Patescibacteria group bacterium]